MTNKAPFCAFLWLTITVLHRQIRSLPTYQVGPRNLFTPLETCLLFLMGRNLWLINDLRLRKITYEKINLFMQNKPNFRKSQMNVSNLLIDNYDKKDTWSSGKNKANSKPIQSQYKANTKPIQSQYKANTKPIQTQFKPKQTQFLSAICVAGQTQSRTYPGRRLSNGLGASLCNRILEVKQMVESQDRCGAKMEYLDLAKLK